MVAEKSVTIVQRVSESVDRIQALKAQFNEAAPSICIERALAFTRSHQKTEGLPLIVRRARAFREVCDNVPCVIFDGELIVGTPGAMQRPGPLCPEISWKWVKEELDTIQERSRDPYVLTKAQKDALTEEIFPYWAGKSVEEIVLSRLPGETKRLGVDSGILDSEIKWRSGVAEIAPEFEDIIFVKGFGGIRDEAKAYLEGVEPTTPEALNAMHFYESIVEVCEGLISLGRRYADKAFEMARLEADEIRERELLEIGEICRRVPENPPRSFREAIQMVWFVQMGCVLAENGPAFNPGRFDQYMYPYYQADVDLGILDDEMAQVLIDCLWIKLSEWLWLLPENGAKYYGGYNAFQNITLGGRKKDGRDATNAVSYLCLKATERCDVAAASSQRQDPPRHTGTIPACRVQVGEAWRWFPRVPQRSGWNGDDDVCWLAARGSPRLEPAGLRGTSSPEGR